MKREDGTTTFHRDRRALRSGERRGAIRQGYESFQFHGWSKDPPYPSGDPRRWYWQDGAETAELVRRGEAYGVEDAPSWAM